MIVKGVAFLGMRIADPAVYEATIAVYRDALGATVTIEDGRRSTRFSLGDGTALHVYGPDDVDHLDFGERTCIGYRVTDLPASLERLREAGIELLDDPWQADGTDAWCHIRMPNGAIHEVLGPDPGSRRPTARPQPLRDTPKPPDVPAAGAVASEAPPDP